MASLPHTVARFFVSITQQWYIESYPPIEWEWRFFASRFLSGYSLWKPMLWHTPLYFPPINVPWTVCVFGRFVSKLIVATVMLESTQSLQPRRNFYSLNNFKHLSTEHRCWKWMERDDGTPVEKPRFSFKAFSLQELTTYLGFGASTCSMVSQVQYLDWWRLSFQRCDGAGVVVIWCYSIYFCIRS